MTTSRPLLHALLVASGTVAALAAQGRPAWATLSIPAGVDPNAALSIGKLSTYRDGPVLHVHSAVTRAWSTLSVSPTATLRLTNDCLVVLDGSTWHGYASHTGRFVPLAVSPQAQLLNALGRDNDSILLVRDGNLLHAFSGFTGTWRTRGISSNFGWSTQRHVALLSDGTLLAGMDAWTGQWHDLQVTTPPNVLSTDGTTGVAYDASTVAAFSANTATWVTAPLPAGAILSRNDDWALFAGTAQTLAYSGVQGTFASLASPVPTLVASEDDFALFDTGAGLQAYSAIRGAFSGPLAPATARARTSVATATLADGPLVHGYSAVTNTLATIGITSTFEEVAVSTAFAIDAATGLPHCFSALTGAWYAPPGDVLPQSPLATTTAILLPTTTGARAFSARTGQFVPLLASGLTLLGNTSSAVNGAWNATDLFAFDARTGRWTTTPRSGSGAPIVQIWRTAMFVADGNEVLGFGAQEGRFERATMPGPYVVGRANSESSRICTANHVLAHAAVAELVATTQFPEFRRIQVLGTPLQLHLQLGSGDFALLGGGFFAPAPTPVPGFGDLVLQPSSMVTWFVPPTPNTTHTRIALPLPSSPWLLGNELAFQALVVPAAGTPWLTGAAAALLL